MKIKVIDNQFASSVIKGEVYEVLKHGNTSEGQFYLVLNIGGGYDWHCDDEDYEVVEGTLDDVERDTWYD